MLAPQVNQLEMLARALRHVNPEFARSKSTLA